jgi:signal transduction histidine kinase
MRKNFTPPPPPHKRTGDRMLSEFLLKNQEEILAMTEKKSVALAGVRPTSDQLKQGLPIFFKQLMKVLQLQRPAVPPPATDKGRMAEAARDDDEQAMAKAAGRPDEAEVAKAAGLHGQELQRLGYTLSHVVHAYGAMCQSITELATTKNISIGTSEFHDLNRCLDIAIAGAVTEYQTLRNTEVSSQEVEHLGSLAHEMRNALTAANISLKMIQSGTVGFGGSTGTVLKNSMKRIENLINRSLTEVRLRVDPKLRAESGQLLQLVDQILVTAEVEARSRNQTLEIQIDPGLIFEADQQLFFSALSNLIQNALKYTHAGGKIQVRGSSVGENIIVEVEDECGGLMSKTAADLFKPFEQQHENRKGLGLGLTIAQRAILLNHGKIEVRNLPGKGCIFQITLPKKNGAMQLEAVPAA